MSFPPAKGKGPIKPVYNSVETGAVSTGKGGLPASLKIKRAGTKDLPQIEKTVNAS